MPLVYSTYGYLILDAVVLDIASNVRMNSLIPTIGILVLETISLFDTWAY